MLIYIEAITKQLTNHINKQSLKPMGRWDKSLRNSKKKQYLCSWF